MMILGNPNNLRKNYFGKLDVIKFKIRFHLKKEIVLTMLHYINDKLQFRIKR